MRDDHGDMNTALMVDGNAIAGELQEIFGRDMTMAATRCGFCAADAALGALLAFTRGPGAVLRCPSCQSTIIRVVETPSAYYVEARGAAYMRFSR